MTASLSRLSYPIDAILFDCDGTLSSIEGIDELANRNQVGAIVQRLTARAMGKTGMHPEIYEKRLTLVNPKWQEVLAIGEAYIKHLTPFTLEVIQLLQRLNKIIYIVSAGMQPAVKILGNFLQIPNEQIFAVDIQFDHQGNYKNFDRTSPLIKKNGKRDIVTALKKYHSTLAYVGDGLSDYEVYDLVTRFIGFGGAYYRKNIENASDYYIYTNSMAALIPLVLTESENQNLNAEDTLLLHHGLQDIQDGKVKIK